MEESEYSERWRDYADRITDYYYMNGWSYEYSFKYWKLGEDCFYCIQDMTLENY